MSTEIEQRVVEMQFDNKQFEQGVSTTMSSLDKLKQSLNLTGAAKGLESVGTAAKGINLSGLSSAAETAAVKFSYLQMSIQHVFNRLIDSAFYTGKRITSALTIDPIKTGFAEYETQINSVQTILANTKSKGTNIDDVNKALDELNTYADKTIYNFTEMTRNIGRFTAAGVDLDTSVSAIKGIANLAAVSGSNSQQASSAMYQLSQALASGKVNLMDWNSVVNAGMGGELFQNALKRTAEVMSGKDIDAIIKKYGSFRESLSKGDWLTTDVLAETLSQLSGAYSEAELLAKGYTKSQAKEIMDLAKTAESAATDVKTFTQLWDTLKESAQSGWAQTWEILVGDFEEAKGLFSSVSKVIGDMIGNSAKSRNELLQGWKDAGGRDDLIAGLKNAFEGLMNIINPIKEAFREVFPKVTVDQLVKFTRGFRELTEKFIFWKQALLPVKGQMEEFGRTEAEIIEHNNRLKKNIDNIVRIFKGLFAIVDVGVDAIVSFGKGIFSLFGMTIPAGEGLLSMLAAIGDWAVGLRDATKESDIFSRAVDKVVGFVGKVVDKLKSVGSAIKEAFRFPDVESLMNIFSGIWDWIVKIGSSIGRMFAPLADAFTNLFRNGRFAESVNSALSAGLLAVITKFVWDIGEAVKPVGKFLKDMGGFGIFKGQIVELFESIGGAFEGLQNKFNAQAIKEIAIAIAILAGALFVLSSIDGEKMDRSLGSITVLFAELMGSLAVFTKLDLGGKGLAKGITAMTALASALLILSVAMKIMSTMSIEEMCVAMLSLVVAMTTLVGAVSAMSTMQGSKAAKSLGALAKSLLVLSVALKIMSTMSIEEMCVALMAAVTGIALLVGALHALPKDSGAKAGGMIALATSLVILGGALKIMGSMNLGELGMSLGALAGSLLAITLAMNFMPHDMALKSLGLLAVASALVILSGALKIMGTMSWDELTRGLAAMGYSLLALAIAIKAMNGSLAGSAALIVAAGALALLAPVMKILGGMSWGEIVKGLVALAGAFAVMGVAGYLLTPLVPTLLSLAGAMAAFGGATLALGIGIAAISWGFTTLAAAGAAGATAFVAAIGALTVGLLGLIPELVRVVTDMLLALCEVVIEVAPALAETILVVVTEVMGALAQYTPQIVDSLLKFLIGVIDALAENMPELITSAVNLIGAFFQGVTDALSGLDTSSLIKGTVGVGLLAALMWGLSALLPVIPSAAAAIVGMGILIAELAAVLAAVGLLAQIPGLSWLIGEGGDLLQQIGTAIGQFVGGIVGGIAEGATSTLPQVGTNLSNFMTNLQPFIDGMAGVDSTILDNTTTLAKAILALTAADLISGIASFITGGGSLGDFAEQIVPFGTAMKDYAAEVSGIDTAAISTSVTAAKDLVKMAGDIPSDGLFGTDGIDDFGRNIVTFGKKMKQYGDEVTGIDAGVITASVSAAKGLVQVAKQIPDDGTFGTDGIDDFGKNIVTFGKKMKQYAGEVSGINTGAVTKSISTVRSLISVINSMTGLDTSGIKSFTTAINDLSKVNFDSFAAAFTTSTARLTTIGKNMFSSIIEGAESMKGRFETTAKSIVETAASAIGSNKGKFKTAGAETIGQFFKGVIDGRSKANSSIAKVLAAAVTKTRSYYSNFYSAGAYLVSGFAAGISANRYKAEAQARAMARAAANAARKELDIQSPSRVGYGIGDFFGIGFVNAISDNVKNAYNASANMADAAESGLKGAFDKVLGIINGEIDVQPTITPVLDLTNVRSGANAINGMFGLSPSVGVLSNLNAVSVMMSQRGQNGGASDIVSAIGKLEKALGNVGNTTNYINGLAYTDSDGTVNEALGVIVRALLMGGRV